MATSWLPTVFAALGSGVLGAAITTYGSRGGERRTARAAMMDAFAEIEQSRHRIDGQDGMSHKAMVAMLNELGRREVVAAMPPRLCSLYADAVRWSWTLRQQIPDVASDASPHVVAGRVAYRAGRLMVDAAWHPWLSWPRRVWEVERQRRLLEAVAPTAEIMLRENRARIRPVERQLLRERRQRRRRGAPAG